MKLKLIAMFFVFLIVTSTFVNALDISNEFNNPNVANRIEEAFKNSAETEAEDILINVGKYEPTVVPSYAFESKNYDYGGYLVKAQLYGIQTNPLIEIPRIRSVQIFNQKPDFPGIAVYPKAPPSGIYTLDNMGYVYIRLPQIKDEKKIPKQINVNLTAKILYDVGRGFGVNEEDKILPVLTESEFLERKEKNSFWSGRGYINVEEIKDDSAIINIYDGNLKKIRTLTIQEGKYSPELYIGYSDFFPNIGEDFIKKNFRDRVKFRLNSLNIPKDRAKLELTINGKFVTKELYEGDRLDEISDWRIKKIYNNGTHDIVELENKREGKKEKLASRMISKEEIKPKEEKPKEEKISCEIEYEEDNSFSPIHNFYYRYNENKWQLSTRVFEGDENKYLDKWMDVNSNNCGNENTFDINIWKFFRHSAEDLTKHFDKVYFKICKELSGKNFDDGIGFLAYVANKEDNDDDYLIVHAKKRNVIEHGKANFEDIKNLCLGKIEEPKKEPIKPDESQKYIKLANLISRGEGGWNSVNNGIAGDTPGGAKSIFGKDLTEITIEEIMQAQNNKPKHKVFAVGRYQFIPETLKRAVDYTKIDKKEKFTQEIQNKLFNYLIDIKQFEVGKYINKKSDNKREAIQSLAREFASVGLEYPENGHQRGESRYGGSGGNKASISPEEIGNVLDEIRNEIRGKFPEITYVPPKEEIKEIETAENIYGTTIESYEKAIEYYKKVVDNYKEIKDDKNKRYYAQEAQERIAEIYHTKLHNNKEAIDAYRYLIDNFELDLNKKLVYQNIINSLASRLDRQTTPKTLYEYGNAIDATLIEIIKTNDPAEIILSMDNQQNTFHLGDIIKNEKINTKWRIEKIFGTEEIEVVNTENQNTISGRETKRISTSMGEIVLGSSLGSSKVKLININSKREARLTVLPGVEFLTSTSQFKLHIPVERRLIQFSDKQIDNQVEATKKIIDSLNKAIDKIEETYDYFSYFCWGVFGWVTIKGLSSGGRNAARKIVMDSYKKACSNDANYINNCKSESRAYCVSKCILDKSKEINEDLDRVQDVIKKVKEDKDLTTDEQRKNYIAVRLRDKEFNNKDLREKVYEDSKIAAKNIIYNKEVDDKVEEFGNEMFDENNNLKINIDEEKLKELGYSDAEINAFNKLGENARRNKAQEILETKRNTLLFEGAGTFTEDKNNGKYYEEILKINSKNGDLIKELIEANKKRLGNENKSIKLNIVSEKTAPQEQYKPLLALDDQGKCAGNIKYISVDSFDYLEIERGSDCVALGFNVIRREKENDNLGYSGKDKDYVTRGIEKNDRKYINQDDCNAGKLIYNKWCNTFLNVKLRYDNEVRTSGGQITDKIKIGGTYAIQNAITKDLGVQCYDLMDPDDCKLLFFACDPVMCPISRFNAGGKWPVNNVVASGFFGSIFLGNDLWSTPEIGICIPGILASLKNYRSIAQGYQQCLLVKKEKGENVGICDIIRSVGICRIIWREGTALLSLDGGLLGVLSRQIFDADSGGGEYAFFAQNLRQTQDFLSFFTNNYATTYFNAYRGGSTEEIGDKLCEAAIYGKLTGPGSFLDQLTKPEGPPQFTATLDEFPHSESEGQTLADYSVYYHIYAGESFERIRYSVYLKSSTLNLNPYYMTQPGPLQQTAYLNRGDFADLTVRRTGPTGYDQVCVQINGIEKCGFGKSSSEFLVDYVQEQGTKKALEQRNITSEDECTGERTVVGRLSQGDVGSAFGSLIGMSEIGETGVQRRCGIVPPDKSTPKESAWIEVGTCGKDSEGRDKGKCWLNTNNVNLLRNKDNIDELNELLLYDKEIEDELNELDKTKAKLFELFDIKLGNKARVLPGPNRLNNINYRLTEIIKNYQKNIPIPEPIKEENNLGNNLGTSNVVKNIITGNQIDNTKVNINLDKLKDDYLPIEVRFVLLDRFLKIDDLQVDKVYKWKENKWGENLISDAESDANTIENLDKKTFDEGLEYIISLISSFKKSFGDKFKQIEATCDGNNYEGGIIYSEFFDDNRKIEKFLEDLKNNCKVKSPELPEQFKKGIEESQNREKEKQKNKRKLKENIEELISLSEDLVRGYMNVNEKSINQLYNARIYFTIGEIYDKLAETLKILNDLNEMPEEKVKYEEDSSTEKEYAVLLSNLDITGISVYYWDKSKWYQGNHDVRYNKENANIFESYQEGLDNIEKEYSQNKEDNVNMDVKVICQNKDEYNIDLEKEDLVLSIEINNLSDECKGKIKEKVKKEEKQESMFSHNEKIVLGDKKIDDYLKEKGIIIDFKATKENENKIGRILNEIPLYEKVKDSRINLVLANSGKDEFTNELSYSSFNNLNEIEYKDYVLGNTLIDKNHNSFEIIIPAKTLESSLDNSKDKVYIDTELREILEAQLTNIYYISKYWKSPDKMDSSSEIASRARVISSLFTADITPGYDIKNSSFYKINVDKFIEKLRVFGYKGEDLGDFQIDLLNLNSFELENKIKKVLTTTSLGFNQEFYNNLFEYEIKRPPTEKLILTIKENNKNYNGKLILETKEINVNFEDLNGEKQIPKDLGRIIISKSNIIVFEGDKLLNNYQQLPGSTSTNVLLDKPSNEKPINVNIDLIPKLKEALKNKKITSGKIKLSIQKEIEINNGILSIELSKTLETGNLIARDFNDNKILEAPLTPPINSIEIKKSEKKINNLNVQATPEGLRFSLVIKSDYNRNTEIYRWDQKIWKKIDYETQKEQIFEGYNSERGINELSNKYSKDDNAKDLISISLICTKNGEKFDLDVNKLRTNEIKLKEQVSDKINNCITQNEKEAQKDKKFEVIFNLKSNKINYQINYDWNGEKWKIKEYDENKEIDDYQDGLFKISEFFDDHKININQFRVYCSNLNAKSSITGSNEIKDYTGKKVIEKIESHYENCKDDEINEKLSKYKKFDVKFYRSGLFNIGFLAKDTKFTWDSKKWTMLGKYSEEIINDYSKGLDFIYKEFDDDKKVDEIKVFCTDTENEIKIDAKNANGKNVIQIKIDKASDECTKIGSGQIMEEQRKSIENKVFGETELVIVREVKTEMPVMDAEIIIASAIISIPSVGDIYVPIDPSTYAVKETAELKKPGTIPTNYEKSFNLNVITGFNDEEEALSYEETNYRSTLETRLEDFTGNIVGLTLNEDNIFEKEIKLSKSGNDYKEYKVKNEIKSENKIQIDKNKLLKELGAIKNNDKLNKALENDLSGYFIKIQAIATTNENGIAITNSNDYYIVILDKNDEIIAEIPLKQILNNKKLTCDIFNNNKEEGYKYNCNAINNCRIKEEDNVFNKGKLDCNDKEFCCRPTCESLGNNYRCTDTGKYDCKEGTIKKGYCAGLNNIICCIRSNEVKKQQSLSNDIKLDIDNKLSYLHEFIKNNPNEDPKKFLQILYDISKDLNMNPNWIMVVAHKETNGKINSKVVNKQGKDPKTEKYFPGYGYKYDQEKRRCASYLVKSSDEQDSTDSKIRSEYRATGLIQFIPSTACGLGTTTKKLYDMSTTEQMNYVKKYFESQIKAGYEIDSYFDAYAITFYPMILKKGKKENGEYDENWIIGSEKSLDNAKTLRNQNKGMDTPIDSTKNYGGNNDGYISIGEFRNYVNSGIPTYYAELIKSDSKDGQKLLASALDNIERTGSLA